MFILGANPSNMLYFACLAVEASSKIGFFMSFENSNGMPLLRVNPQSIGSSEDSGACLGNRTLSGADRITMDSNVKVTAMSHASSIRRSVSSKLAPTGVERVDICLSQRHAIADRLAACGSLIAYRAWQRGECEGLTRYVSDRCGMHLLCPFCAAYRSRRLLSQYAPRCDAVVHNSRQPLQAWLITFTVKNGPDLVERFEHLTRSLRAMLTHVSKGRESFFSALAGGAYALEVKRGSGAGLWHPHCHMVALAPMGHFFDWRGCKAEWFRWTGDSSVLNFSPMAMQGGSYGAAMREVFKYMTSFKDCDLSPVDRFLIHCSLKGKRTVGNFGLMRDPCLDDDEHGQMGRFGGFDFHEFNAEFSAYTPLRADAVKLLKVDGQAGSLTVKREGLPSARFHGLPDSVVGVFPDFLHD